MRKIILFILLIFASRISYSQQTKTESHDAKVTQLKSWVDKEGYGNYEALKFNYLLLIPNMTVYNTQLKKFTCDTFILSVGKIHYKDSLTAKKLDNVSTASLTPKLKGVGMVVPLFDSHLSQYPKINLVNNSQVIIETKDLKLTLNIEHNNYFLESLYNYNANYFNNFTMNVYLFSYTKK